jgi:predicted porin
MDWSVGLTYTLGNFDLGLKYTDGSDLDDLDDFCRVFPADCVGVDKDVFSTDGRVVFSVSTTFPWAKE